jgi:deoxyribodipyrimidine photo-lyase
MAELAPIRWEADAATIGAVLKGAREVRSIDDPHIKQWLGQWATCEAAPALFPSVQRRCDSFSQWWTKASRGVGSAAELLAGGRASARAPAW